ncbi:MAG: manganese ABC transporter ATP-binding protein [SAR86 cluster bacterium]|uniref:Manganese ABC transporter ATP-binding protein n=1 Tax=SAR86 cluster bacterium TaxID=2030880 RepID=A0A2A5BBA2_9GAMM|nr:MAG: manganese ABC transporter ATP-binding protein [SAR86 cluster bacterium]
MRGPEIQCQQVNLSLGGVDILSDVNLTIAGGEIHCVIGPNGGGKTSLIRSVLGQMPHTGSIEISWGDNSDNQTIGYVPQFLDFDKSLPISVNDFMAMVCNTYRPAFFGPGRDSRAITEAALERVGLAGKRKARLGSLSGGERQRILFAQALIPEPALLVLDEPMSSMDQRGEAIFLDTIRQLSADGTTIIWIAHDLQQVREIANSISCIERTVVYSGPPLPYLDSDEAAEMFRYIRPASVLRQRASQDTVRTKPNE